MGPMTVISRVAEEVQAVRKTFPFFITVEGVDGCGKTTVSEALHNELRSRGMDCVLTQEPTRTWLGDVVKRSFEEGVNAFTETLLFLADRAEHTALINKWIGEGRVVICDRYCDSTYAYQGAALKMEGFPGDAMAWLRTLSSPFVREPDVTFLLMVDTATALERIEHRSRKTKFEKVDFLERVNENFLDLSLQEDRIVTVDANRPAGEVIEEVLRTLFP